MSLPLFFPPLFLLPCFHSFLYLSLFLLRWDWEKGKRSLAEIWNVLIAVWTPVSLRKLNWPAVMSQYSALGDLPHLTLISRAPDSAWTCRQAIVTAHICQCGQLQWGHGAIWNLCLRGPKCCNRNTSYHRGRKCNLWRLESSYRLFCSSTFPPTSVHSITLSSPLLCHWNPSSFLFSSCPLTNLTFDTLIRCRCWYPNLLLLCVLSLHFSLLPTAQYFSMSASLHLFTHHSPMQHCKRKAHNCSPWPRDFLVIAITMLSGLLMSPYSSLCLRSLWLQIKAGDYKTNNPIAPTQRPGGNLLFCLFSSALSCFHSKKWRFFFLFEESWFNSWPFFFLVWVHICQKK